jgi:hypothetical protein
LKADYSSEVLWLEYEEASEMLVKLARNLSIESMVGKNVISNICEYFDGHPYVMNILIGEIAKEGKYIPLKSVLPRCIDILNAAFERSFNRLSEAGSLVFLTIAN